MHEAFQSEMIFGTVTRRGITHAAPSFGFPGLGERLDVDAVGMQYVLRRRQNVSAIVWLDLDASVGAARSAGRVRMPWRSQYAAGDGFGFDAGPDVACTERSECLADPDHEYAVQSAAGHFPGPTGPASAVQPGPLSRRSRCCRTNPSERGSLVQTSGPRSACVLMDPASHGVYPRGTTSPLPWG